MAEPCRSMRRWLSEAKLVRKAEPPPNGFSRSNSAAVHRTAIDQRPAVTAPEPADAFELGAHEPSQWTVTVGGGAGRRPEGRRSRWSVARMGWRDEEPICRWVTRRAEPPDAVISARKAPGRLGRRMLRIRLLQSTKGQVVATCPCAAPFLMLGSTRLPKAGAQRVSTARCDPRRGPTVNAGPYRNRRAILGGCPQLGKSR